ncbi:MAG: hypothetical protein WBL35_00930, partial [Ornithinibacter sp.]
MPCSASSTSAVRRSPCTPLSWHWSTPRPKLAEARLWRHHEQALRRLRRSAEHVLATTTGPLLLVDDDGWVAHHAGVLVHDRIAAPRADHPLAVPGLG